MRLYEKLPILRRHKKGNRYYLSFIYHLSVLTKFGLQGQIYNAIMAQYSVQSAQVYSAHTLSLPFQISNGTRQRGPLSPLIFNLIMEPLAEHIRSIDKCQVFKMAYQEHNISLFANNLILIITDPVTPIPEV